MGTPSIPPPAPIVSLPLGASPYISNASSANTRAIALAKAKFRAGSDIYAGVLGTSTSTGRGAGTGTNGIFGARAKSNAMYFSNILVGLGFASSADAIISTNNYGSTGAFAGTDRYLDFNSTVTIESTVWSADANTTVGGPLFINASGGDTGALTLAPPKAFNTVDILYSRASGGPTMTLDIAGGTVTDVVASNATADVFLQTVTTGSAAAVQTVNVKRKVGASSGNFRMIGLIPRDSATPRVNVLGLGWSGGIASIMTATTNPFSPLNALTFLRTSGRLDVLWIKIGENDIWNNSAGTPIDVTAFKASIALLIVAAQSTTTAVILELIAPQSIARDPTSAYIPYNQAMTDLAAQYGCPLLNNFALYGGGYTVANASGLMFDDVHSFGKGYALEAGAMAAFFAAV